MTVARARSLRKNLTDAEKRLWSRLRLLKSSGFHFRKQAPIGTYVVDFCCHAAGLIIEVDGGQHNGEIDRARTTWLEGRGYKVLRFWNNDVLTNIEGVVSQITAAYTPTPTPPRKGEGLRNARN